MRHFILLLLTIRSTKDKVLLPFNANLGFIQPQTPENEQVFHDAANHTADQLAGTWLYFAESVTINDSCFSSQQEHCNDVFLLLGFPSVLQSDRGGEFLNAMLHRLTKLLSIQ